MVLREKSYLSLLARAHVWNTFIGGSEAKNKHTQFPLLLPVINLAKRYLLRSFPVLSIQANSSQSPHKTHPPWQNFQVLLESGNEGTNPANFAGPLKLRTSLLGSDHELQAVLLTIHRTRK